MTIVRTLSSVIILACLLLVAGVSTASGQEQRRSTALQSLENLSQRIEEGRGAYVREVFSYPRYGRVDPVVPPASVSSADGFPRLELAGIVFNEKDPDLSAAIIRVGARDFDRRVVRAGERIDQYVVVRVERDRVVLDVQMLGTVKRFYLERGSGEGQAQGGR